jgi:hypothetical protein
MPMGTFTKLTSLFAVLAALSVTAHAGGKSTITFGRSDDVATKPARKRNFRQDIDAVNKAHDNWKKAHLNSALYACQRNSERVATLARKVSDRLEASKKDAVASAKALEKAVSASVGADATEIPDSVDNVKALKAKADQLAKAKKQADLLEHLAGQVAHFYEFDMPKESAVDGNCVAEYGAAMKKGVAASLQYHADTESLAMKVEKLAKLAEVAWKKALSREMVAAR